MVIYRESPCVNMTKQKLTKPFFSIYILFPLIIFSFFHCGDDQTGNSPLGACLSHRDCLPGYYCHPQLHTCQVGSPNNGLGSGENGDGGTTNSGGNNTDGSGSQTADGGSPSENQNSSTDSGTGSDSRTTSLSGTKKYTDSCSMADECQSKLCIANTNFSGKRFCSKQCSQDQNCATDHICLPLGDSGQNICVINDTGKECSLKTPEKCLTGICLGSKAIPAGFCSRKCNSGSQCPGGYSCSTLNSAGGADRYCTQLEQACGNNASSCYSGLCLDGLCTGDCRTSQDCPTKHQCSQVQGRSVCVPDSQGKKTFGISCSTADDCKGGICLPETGGASFCSSYCDRIGGCPKGYGCSLATDDNNKLLQLCLRGGSGGFGESCQDNTNCRSALCVTSDVNNKTFCTRLCAQNSPFCPTGYACKEAGQGFMACEPK